MKALTFHDVRTIVHESVEDPAVLDPGDVIVQVERGAICGSDLHVYHGREQGLDAGTVMGHEFVGRIVETGTAVRGLTRDERVYSPFTTSCGECPPCRRGLTARCVSGQLFGWVADGAGLHGAQAEFVRVPLASSTLVPVPDDVDAEAALLLGDVLSTGYFCAEQAGAGPGVVCAVIGCGPVGLMAILGARHLGAERVFALDRVPERLAHARAFGAEPLDVGRDDALERILEATNGLGADAVLEVVGSEAAHRTALRLVRAGGVISVVGVHNGDGFGFRPVELYDRNLTYRVGRCPARSLMERLAPLAASHQTELQSIFTHRFPLARGPEGYRLFDEKRDGCVKVLLLPD